MKKDPFLQKNHRDIHQASAFDCLPDLGQKSVFLCPLWSFIVQPAPKKYIIQGSPGKYRIFSLLPVGSL
jgi:hypothetical protein